MRLVSVNVGTPKEIDRRRGGDVASAILKRPVEGPVIVRAGLYLKFLEEGRSSRATQS